MYRRVCRITAIAVMAAVMLSGCAENKADDKALQEPSKYGRGVTVSNNIMPDEGRVLTCMAGYEKKGSKKALVQDMSGAAGFSVIDVNTDEAVFDGRVKYKKETSGDDAVGVCDFSPVEKTGSFYVRIDTGRVSDVFTIEENIYKRLLSDRLSSFGEADSVSGYYTKEDVGGCCLRITDYLLAQEFFPDSISPVVNGDAKIVPRTTLLAKAETDMLRDYIREDGTLKAPMADDADCLYRYSAVFALFAYEYGEYDKKYALECTAISEKAYAAAEDRYTDCSVSEKKKADDKRFWSSAQLYKLTGKKQYRDTAESYVEDTPTGWNEDECGYLGTLAYLTCYYKIDLDVSGQFITELMDDINEVVRESFKDDYLVADGGIDMIGNDGAADDPDMEGIKADKVYEKARLAVLGNYISKNIKYVECAENYLAYLYGRNMLGKDYAYSGSAEYYNEPQMFILAGLIDSYIYEDKQPEAMER